MDITSTASDKRVARQYSQNVEFNRDAIKILNLLFSINKTLKIYDINNVLAVDLIKSLHQALQDVINKYNEASILLHQNSLFFNGVKIKFGFSTFHCYQHIEREFHNRNIGQLSFPPGINEKQLHKFLPLFQEKEKEITTTFEGFKEDLKTAGLDTIGLERYVHVERKTPEEDGKKQAARAYFWGVTHLKEIFQKYESKKKIPILTTKRLIQTLFMQLSENESFLRGMTTVKNFDEYTLNHSVNVCVLSLAFGKRLGLDKSELVDLGLSAFFHDIGKLDVPIEILNKPGKLDQEERGIVENHSHLGAETLVQLRDSSYIPISAIAVAMEHHSGEGDRAYPKYTKKKNIGLFSKIVKIVDVFDAITTKRPYRKKDFTQVEALSFMMEKCVGEFDPILLKVFIKMIGAIPVGTLVLLDTGEIGIVTVINPNPAFEFRPLLKLITDKTGRKIDGAIVDLSKMEAGTGKYSHAIEKVLDPSDYDIRVSDYFIAQTR